MADSRLDVDTSKINALFQNLENNKDRKNAIKSGLRRSAGIIRRAVRRNMKDISPGFAALKKDVHLSVYKNASGARVDIIDYRKKDSKAFTLKYFNSGTQERITRKGISRGQIPSYGFFTQAVQQTRSQAEAKLQEYIVAYINKKAAKK